MDKFRSIRFAPCCEFFTEVSWCTFGFDVCVHRGHRPRRKCALFYTFHSQRT